MHYIAFGKLKNHFIKWAETISRVRDEINRKREDTIYRLAKATCSKEQFAFMVWRDTTYAALKQDRLTKKMIDKMLRSAGLMVYNLFTRWKLSTFTDMEKRREIKRNGILNNMMDTLDKTHRKNLKAGFNGVAQDSMNTSARQKVLNRLGYACFGRLQQAFIAWKSDTFRKFAMEVERKKAKCIDTLIR
jgi:hypothetical protein